MDFNRTSLSLKVNQQNLIHGGHLEYTNEVNMVNMFGKAIAKQPCFDGGNDV